MLELICLRGKDPPIHGSQGNGREPKNGFVLNMDVPYEK